MKSAALVLLCFLSFNGLFEPGRRGSQTLIEELRNLFTNFGIPERLLMDKGPSCVPMETEDSLKKNEVMHFTTPPYDLATNG
ncbi:hypothetical protein V5799_018673, partial [Amblyomma americanum]